MYTRWIRGFSDSHFFFKPWWLSGIFAMSSSTAAGWIRGWNGGCWSKRKAPDEAGDKGGKMKVSIWFRLSLDFVFLSRVSDGRTCNTGECEQIVYEQERTVIYPRLQIEFEAPRDDWVFSDWIRTKEPSVVWNKAALHSLAYEEDAPETVPRHHESLKPPVIAEISLGSAKAPPP